MTDLDWAAVPVGAEVEIGMRLNDGGREHARGWHIGHGMVVFAETAPECPPWTCGCAVTGAWLQAGMSREDATARARFRVLEMAGSRDRRDGADEDTVIARVLARYRRQWFRAHPAGEVSHAQG